MGWYNSKGVRKKFFHEGSRNPNAKLKETDVLKIRQRLKEGELQSSIAEDFGVSVSLIGYIGQRKCWTHLPEGYGG